MKIGGLQKFSLIDYPGKTAAVIFTQGCNMFCPYCHNPQLVYPELFETELDKDSVFSFLKKRKGLLEGVTVTGGEPAIHADIDEFIGEIKDIGYCLKLDTNGALPGVVARLIEKKLVDFIAMDIKAPLQKYNLFYKGEINNIKESISLIQKSQIPHLFRTTYDTDILTDKDIEEIEKLVSPSSHILQECIKRRKSIG